jgi:hypothetical protein
LKMKFEKETGLECDGDMAISVPARMSGKCIRAACEEFRREKLREPSRSSWESPVHTISRNLLQ